MAKSYTLGEKSVKALAKLFRDEANRSRTTPQPRGVVRTSPGGRLLVKTDAAHAKSASGTCSIYTGTPGSESDTGENITAYNKFADLASGKWAWAANNGSGWYLIAGEC